MFVEIQEQKGLHILKHLVNKSENDKTLALLFQDILEQPTVYSKCNATPTHGHAHM